MKTFRVFASLAACLTAAYAGAGFAQDYPNRPIRLIVPFAPGGGSDFMGRLIGRTARIRLRAAVVPDGAMSQGGAR